MSVLFRRDTEAPFSETFAHDSPTPPAPPSRVPSSTAPSSTDPSAASPVAPSALTTVSPPGDTAVTVTTPVTTPAATGTRAGAPAAATAGRTATAAPAAVGGGAALRGMTPARARAGEPTIYDIVKLRLVTAEFQPIVRLDTAEPVAYEAFARGPAGTAMNSPRAMFDAAAPLGLAAELDQVAHAAAYRQALEAKLHPSMSLFVNADARELGAPVPDDLQGVFALARARLRMLIEVSERTLVAAPGMVLSRIEKARASGWGIGWDNLGATPDALALMPFVGPDVVKINVGLAHGGFRGHAGRVVNAVIAYAERSGAAIMATGIESDAHMRTALGIGAVLGQGYHFGHPGALPHHTTAPRSPIKLINDAGPVEPTVTPYELFAAERQPSAATQDMLESLANQLEQRVAIDPEPPVVIACLPGNRMLSGAPLAQLQLISRGAGFVAAVMGEVPPFGIPGVRTVQLAADDPARGEWALVVVGPHFSALLTAREDANARDHAYNFRYGLTYERPLVERAARALLHRLGDADGEAPLS